MIHINTYFSRKFSLNLKLVLNNFLRFNKALISNVFKYQISRKGTDTRKEGFKILTGYRSKNNFVRTLKIMNNIAKSFIYNILAISLNVLYNILF